MERDPALEGLARRAASGDRAALRELYRRTADRLFREVLVPVLGARAACEDALKETFVSVLEHPERLAAGEVFPYLATIARNKALDRRRRQATEGRFQEALAAELARAEATLPDPESLAQAAQARALAQKRVEQVLAQMNPRYALALKLRLLDELSRDACAAQLGITVGTFDVLLFRACKQFRGLDVETQGPQAEGRDER